MASGAPVIAYGRGGLLDTVNCLSNPSPNKISTGILFKKQSSQAIVCLLYTSPSPRDLVLSRMPSSA